MAQRGFFTTIKGWFSGRTVEAPSTGGGGGAKRDPNATLVKKIGLSMDGSNRDFTSPDFDLTQITTAYDTEAYVRQAIDKYIELMFKSGWDMVGKNQAAVDYIRLRFKLMAEMTQIPTDQLFIEIAEDVVKYSNAILLKARDNQNLLGATKTGIKVQGLSGQAPIVGYFPANATTFSVKRDKNGTVKGWQQDVTGGDKPQKFKPEDVVHIYYKREKGKPFGTPFILSALDDIRALRQAEETVLRLIYRNLNPLLHIKVGTDDLPGQQPEIDTTKNEFENMDLEAGFVTSERITIASVASNQIIDAKEYLRYFEQRVFTGLGVSELMMGRGNTANRSTGDNLSGEFLDRVKAFQRIISIFIDEFVIKELLMEGGFDPVLNPDDAVNFTFKEIDVDQKIKMENHAIFQYEHNAITEDEMRALLGRDPVADRAIMYMNLVQIPLAQATAAAKAAAAGTSSGGTGTPSANNKNKPTNQHGTKAAPKKQAASTEFSELYISQMEGVFENSHTAVVHYLESKSKDKEILSTAVRTTEEDLLHVMQHYLGIDCAGQFANQIHSVCERLFKELAETIDEMTSTQREERVYETVGGIYHVLHIRLVDIAERAHESYITVGYKEVE